VNKLVLPLPFSLGLDRGYAHDGGAHNRWIAVRMSVPSLPGSQSHQPCERFNETVRVVGPRVES
jgi:hypothetical protein